MEEIMTNEGTPENSLNLWWSSKEFAGKEFCILTESGELCLRKAEHYPERAIAVLVLESADATINALSEKFPEVESRVKEVHTEWEAAEDKLKLLGKVSRLRDYLLHTNAIGDFNSLFQNVEAWENTLKELIENNFRERAVLIENAEKIAGEGQDWKEGTQLLKDITEQWKQQGFVDKERSDELWSRLEAAKNKFFERKRQYHEEHEKEMLANLDLKMELVEKAEGLANDEHWKETSEVFRQLMEQWKTIGRTLPEKNEELWNRFILAKNNFFDRKRAHFEVIQVEQENNYALKLALVEKAEALKESTDWNKTSQAYNDLMEEWKKVGRVPLEKADELWNRVKDAKDYFYNNKRQHLETVKVALDDNYAQKLALLKRAEELKHSSHWREATEEMNELMTEWKKIGPVPREHSNSMWEQFIGARKFFFERKDADRERRKQQVERQIQHKQSKAKNFVSQLEAELKEEQEKLVDFKEALENVTPGNKAEELRTHLEKLIAQTEQKVKHKEEKIKDVMAQTKDKEAPSKTTVENKEEEEDNSTT